MQDKSTSRSRSCAEALYAKRCQNASPGNQEPHEGHGTGIWHPQTVHITGAWWRTGGQPAQEHNSEGYAAEDTDLARSDSACFWKALCKPVSCVAGFALQEYNRVLLVLLSGPTQSNNLTCGWREHKAYSAATKVHRKVTLRYVYMHLPQETRDKPLPWHKLPGQHPFWFSCLPVTKQGNSTSRGFAKFVSDNSCICFLHD